MILIRRHVFAVSPPLQIANTEGSASNQPTRGNTTSTSRLSLLLGRLKPKKQDSPRDDDY